MGGLSMPYLVSRLPRIRAPLLPHLPGLPRLKRVPYTRLLLHKFPGFHLDRRLISLTNEVGPYDCRQTGQGARMRTNIYGKTGRRSGARSFELWPRQLRPVSLYRHMITLG